MQQVESGLRYLPCPKCGQLMNRLNFAHRSGVIIDICSRHGVWFDRDGLQHIIEFIRSGGMERAREIERAELTDEIRRLSVFNETHEADVANAIATGGAVRVGAQGIGILIAGFIAHREVLG